MEATKVLPKHVAWVEDAVRENPNDYNARLSLLKVLKEAGLSQKLDEARRAFAGVFPLPEAVWVAWLSERFDALRAHVQDGDDEEAVARTGGDLVALLRRAVADCAWSASVWQTYHMAMQLLSVALPASEYGFDAVRAVFEGSAAVLGHHPHEGESVWKDFIEWEEEMCMALEQVGELSKKQKDHIRTLYARALAAPLQSHDELWTAYTEWEEEEKKVPGLQKRRDAGRKAFASRRKLEESIAALRGDAVDLAELAQNAQLYQSLLDYLAFEEGQLTGKKEKGKRNVSSCVSVMERALSVYSTSAELWLRYLSILSKWGTDEQLAAWVGRAPRYCKWSGPVHSASARVRCKLGQDAEETRGALTAALAGGLATADDYHAVYGALEDCFPDEDEHSASHEAALRTYFPERHDLAAALHEYRALRAARAGDAEQFCAHWEAALKSWGSTAWDTWNRYIGGAELLHVEAHKLRSLYKRAINVVQDAPEASFATWTLWERRCGTPATQLDALISIERRTRAVAAMRLQWQRKQEALAPVASAAAPPAAAKHSKKAAKPDGSSAGDAGGEGSLSAPAAVASKEAPSKEEKAARTVFVKNLSFEIDEAALQALFGPLGDIVETRLMRDPNTGNSRGFAFIEFATKQDAASTLVLDGRVEMGRAMVVMPSSSSLGDSGAIPVNTLYVSNLPFDCEDKDVRAAFEGAAAALLAANPIRSIRVLQSREGRGKGGAFVEFVRNLAPDTIKLDGIVQVKGRPMKVEFAKTKKLGQRLKEAAATDDGNAPEPVQKRVKVDAEHAADGDGGASAPTSSSSSSSSSHSASAVAYDDSRTVFVGSIMAGATEVQVRDQMEALCGPVVGVRLTKSSSHIHGGKAYVDFVTAEAREKALSLSGKLAILDHPVIISAPKPREKGKSLKGTTATGFGAAPAPTTAAVSSATPKAAVSLVPPSLARAARKRQATDGDDGKPKTQDDFRKMLLGAPK